MAGDAERAGRGSVNLQDAAAAAKKRNQNVRSQLDQLDRPPANPNDSDRTGQSTEIGDD